jgi:hypothetical protein
MRKFLEEEAELGSDNEDNDDVRKNINRQGDEEEDEEGLDDDLEGFVVHPGDEEEIGEANEELYDKYQRDMEEKDKQDIQRTLAAVLFGANNKKRKRNEVEGLDDQEGHRRKRLMEERLRQLQD